MKIDKSGNAYKAKARSFAEPKGSPLDDDSGGLIETTVTVNSAQHHRTSFRRLLRQAQHSSGRKNPEVRFWLFKTEIPRQARDDDSWGRFRRKDCRQRLQRPPVL